MCENRTCSCLITKDYDAAAAANGKIELAPWTALH